jgi:glycosyltransferase involved in cell wall biosynthesis
MIHSVVNQTYSNWELVLADGSSISAVETECLKLAQQEPRIKYIKLENNLGISENTNIALKAAQGDYIGLLDHDDILHQSLLYEIVNVIEKNGADFIYTDEAVFREDLNHIEYVKLKAAFSKYELRAHNYICHFICWKAELNNEIGYLRSEFNGSQDHDFVLRATEVAKNIVHIPIQDLKKKL